MGVASTKHAETPSSPPQRPLFVTLAVVSLAELLAMRIPGINERTGITLPIDQRKALLAEMLNVLQSLPWRTNDSSHVDDRDLIDKLDVLITGVLRHPAVHAHPLVDLEDRLSTLLQTVTAPAA
jgi:hypothetical protein